MSDPINGSAWVFLAFDVDGIGKPGNARVLGTSGDTALDRAGVAALLDNRYAPGPGYRGCTYRFCHNGRPDRPSPAFPADAPADTGDQPGCKVDPKSITDLLNGTAYPRPFWRRRIEGVAVVSYDTAPWGAVGNAKVLVSEPDQAFGSIARDSFANARVVESEQGRRGCEQHVRFQNAPPNRARLSHGDNVTDQLRSRGVQLFTFQCPADMAELVGPQPKRPTHLPVRRAGSTEAGRVLR